MRCTQVPELEVPPGQIPSGKYVVVVDTNGDSKMLARITGKGILYFDGDDIFFANGSDDLPIYLPNFKKFAGPAFGLLAFDNPGRLMSLVNETNVVMILQSVNGQITFAPLSIDLGGGTLPDTGAGILVKQPSQDPAYYGLKGMVYITDDGTVTQIENGVNGQIVGMSGGIPKFISLPSGNVASGSGVATLEGVSAGSLSASQVNIAVPIMQLTDGATQIQVTGVNVTFDFANGVANDGLDDGAEQANTWYYLYIISDGATVACVASESAMAPDLTTFGAFQFWGFVGVFRNDGSGNIVTFVQRGRNIWTPQVNMSDDVAITTSFNAVPQSVPMTNIVPPIAKTARGIAGGASTATTFLSIVIAADAGGTGLFFLGATEHAAAVDGFKKDAGMFEVPILDGFAPSLYWKANANNNHRRISFTGYSI